MWAFDIQTPRPRRGSAITSEAPAVPQFPPLVDAASLVLASLPDSAVSVFGSPVTTKRSVRDGVESQTQTTPTLEEAIKEAK